MDEEKDENRLDNDNMEKAHVDENALSEGGLSNDDYPASLTIEDRIENERVQALVNEINNDIEDDLYGRDGDTNDSELAPQRLEALSGRLKGAFAQAASQLLTVVGTAMEKKAIAEKAKDQADILDAREKKKRQEEDQARDDADETLDDIDRQRKQEREEWAKTKHSYFGANLTGNEWSELADMLGKDSALRDRLIQRLIEQGKSRDEAEKKADEMAKLYRILAKPESQRTEEERRQVEAAKTDPDYTNNTKWLAYQRDGMSGYAKESTIEKQSTTAAQEASVAAGADLLASASTPAGGITDHRKLAKSSEADASVREPLTDREFQTAKLAAVPADLTASSFPNAPDLSAHYQAAASLPDQKPTEIASKVEVAFAKTPPMPAASAGFEV